MADRTIQALKLSSATTASGGGGANHGQSTTITPPAATAAATNMGLLERQIQSATPMQKMNQVIRPKTVIIRRQDNHGFGFTLRHFIVYPPDANNETPSNETSASTTTFQLTEPMDTVFVKEVRPYGPAHMAGLQTGDRLLAVNGLSVNGLPYAHVVSIIQQIPSVLTLQVVPKECDILQTFFSETAHNPETNQRPRICPPSALTVELPHEFLISQNKQQQQQQQQQQQIVVFPHPPISILQEQQQQQQPINFQTTYQPQLHYESPPQHQNQQQQQISDQISSTNRQLALQKYRPSDTDIYNLLYKPVNNHQNRRESQVSTTSSVGSSSHESSSTAMTTMKELNDNALMLRLKKNFEQKEEFMKRSSNNQQPVGSSTVVTVINQQQPPPSPTVTVPVSTDGQSILNSNQITNVKQREFYARPKRLQKSIWPPTQQDINGGGIIIKNGDTDHLQKQLITTTNTSIPSAKIAVTTNTATKQLDDDVISAHDIYYDRSQLKSNEFIPIQNNKENDNISNQTSQQQQIRMMRSKPREQFFNEKYYNVKENDDNNSFVPPAQGLHIVSERTKLFESGRPLSPDGNFVDRTLLYKSELSRLNTKVAIPNVNQRKKEFEQFVENSDYHRLLDDRDRSTSTDYSEVSRRIPSRNGILSIEPIKNDSEKSLHSELSVPESFVLLRNQKSGIDDDERRTRRISYLRATANDSALHHSDTADGISFSTISPPPPSSSPLPGVAFIDDDNKKSPIITSSQSPRLSSAGTERQIKVLLYPMREANIETNSAIIHEGHLQIKITIIEGKRSHDRSWKTVWAELNGNKLKLTIQRDGKASQSLGVIDLRNFYVADANYTKRKYVFKLTSITISRTSTFSPYGPTELLLQAENDEQMTIWRDLLHAVCGEPEILLKRECINDVGNQIAEPQSVAAVKIVQTSSTSSSSSSSTVQTGAGTGIINEENLSSTSKTTRKYYLGSRSPSGQSPVTKSRKTPQQLNIPVGQSEKEKKESSDKETGSPKPKTWKGLVARQLRKIQGQPGSGGSGTYATLPEGASIGVPLSHCVPSDENEFVPLIVARCTSIVEQRGLEIVGIYRIPGNTAAITALTEQVNRGFDEQTLNDPKWDDVNVVSSLLKSFIRNLPEPLLPNDMYGGFINADKSNGRARLQELKELLENLPPHCYETLKHLMRHLNRVSRKCYVNLMEPKNIAIVFGPSVVRTSNETLETAVKDMKHQCRIVEALVLYYEYFFENGLMPDINDASSPTVEKDLSDQPTTNLLLDNVAKIEPLRERESSSSIVASIVQAANRKIRKSSHRKTILSTGTPDNLSLDSSTSTESKEMTTIHQQHLCGSSSDTKDSMMERMKHRLSEDDSNDSTFVENGSMSLTTVTIALDNKLRSLRCSIESDRDSDIEQKSINKQPLQQPLTLGDNLPFADESPERSLIAIKSKPSRDYNKILISKQNNNNIINGNGTVVTTITATTATIPSSLSSVTLTTTAAAAPTTTSTSTSTTTTAASSITETIVNPSVDVSSSDDTDTSTTSIPIRIDADVLRKMNRILTNLERNTTKMNRSLSLNYKSQQKGGECCCHVNHRLANRVPMTTLTKDEKTDKNINKKRHSQENKGHRRYGGGNRSIRRRHTVGGTHDYSPKYIDKTNQNNDNYTPCHNYVMRRSSSPE